MAVSYGITLKVLDQLDEYVRKLFYYLPQQDFILDIGATIIRSPLAVISLRLKL